MSEELKIDYRKLAELGVRLANRLADGCHCSSCPDWGKRESGGNCNECEDDRGDEGDLIYLILQHAHIAKLEVEW